jgi:hypothetical protein
VVSLLAHHQNNTSLGHNKMAHYAKWHVILLDIWLTQKFCLFTSCKQSTLESFLHFPVPSQVMSMTDANWGPQDVTQSKPTMDLPLFASRSMSAFYIDLLGQHHWLSK